MLINSKLHEFPKESKKVFQGTIFSVWQWKQKLFDGSTAIFEGIGRVDTVHTIGILDDGRILLIDDEQPHRKSIITPAGGMVDQGEAPEAAAKREFLEETGYQIRTLVPWHKYQPSEKYQYLIRAYVGRGLKKVSEPTLGAGEKIKVLTFTFDEFLELGRNSKMRDLAIRNYLLEAQLDNRKKRELKKLFYGEN